MSLSDEVALWEVETPGYALKAPAQVVERVSLCSEGRRLDPRTANCIMVVVSLGKTLHPPCLV